MKYGLLEYFLVRLKEHPSSRQPFSFPETICKFHFLAQFSTDFGQQGLKWCSIISYRDEKFMIFLWKLINFEQKGVLNLGKTPAKREQILASCETMFLFFSYFKIWYAGYRFKKILSTFWKNEGHGAWIFISILTWKLVSIFTWKLVSIFTWILVIIYVRNRIRFAWGNLALFLYTYFWTWGHHSWNK